MVQEISLDAATARLPAVDERNDELINYVNVMRDLFARASAQSTRFGDKNHTNTTELKRDIRTKTKSSAELQERIGKSAFYAAIFGGVCALLQLSPERQPVQNMFKFLGEQGSQGFNSMYSSFKMSEKQLLDAVVAMRQTEYQANSQKDPAATMQQNLQQLLDVAQGMNQKAAAAG